MTIVLASGQDSFRMKEHTKNLLETEVTHGADGKDAVCGMLVGIQEFIKNQVDDKEFLIELAELGEKFKTP